VSGRDHEVTVNTCCDCTTSRLARVCVHYVRLNAGSAERHVAVPAAEFSGFSAPRTAPAMGRSRSGRGAQLAWVARWALRGDERKRDCCGGELRQSQVTLGKLFGDAEHVAIRVGLSFKSEDARCTATTAPLCASCIHAARLGRHTFGILHRPRRSSINPTRSVGAPMATEARTCASRSRPPRGAPNHRHPNRPNCRESFAF
jgi:hypothetical protein